MNNSHSKLPQKLLKVYPTHSLRQYLAHQSVHQSSNMTESSPALLQIEIDIGAGKTQTLRVDEDTDIEGSAQKICKKHNLEPYISQLLAQSIREQYEREVNEQDNQRQAEIAQQLRQIYTRNSAKEVLLGSQSPQKLFPQDKNSRTYESNEKYSFSKKSDQQQIFNENQREGKPKINAVSRLICQKYGKDNILKWKEKRSREKMNLLRKQKEQKQKAGLEECVFHPKINVISQKVDQEISDYPLKEEKRVQRYELLYDNFQEQLTKRIKQKENTFAQHSFQPNINSISRLIVQGKRNSEHLSMASSKQSAHSHCREEKSKQGRPKTGRKPANRNKGGLPIGQYLYKQGKRHSKPEALEQKPTFKALEQSQYLVSILKSKKIKEIFHHLTKPPHQQLIPSDIPETDQIKKSSLRHILPIFEEILEGNYKLTLQNFTEATLQLIDQLTPEDKHQLLFQKYNLGQNSQVQSRTISRQVSGQLYAKGQKLMEEKEMKLAISRQSKARQELKYCTFKPILNR